MGIWAAQGGVPYKLTYSRSHNLLVQSGDSNLVLSPKFMFFLTSLAASQGATHEVDSAGRGRAWGLDSSQLVLLRVG